MRLPFYDKKMAKEFERKFECIGENRGKYKTFSVPIKKEVIKIDKNGNKSVETISYKIKFIDSMRSMALHYLRFTYGRNS